MKFVKIARIPNSISQHSPTGAGLHCLNCLCHIACHKEIFPRPLKKYNEDGQVDAETIPTLELNDERKRTEGVYIPTICL